jgi:hypothetical protein
MGRSARMSGGFQEATKTDGCDQAADLLGPYLLLAHQADRKARESTQPGEQGQTSRSPRWVWIPGSSSLGRRPLTGSRYK